jgi:hypothetical protein
MKKTTEKQIANIIAKKKNYKYTNLESLEVGTEMVNFFAVILEATFPHKSKKSEKFVVSLKLADLSSKFDKDGVVSYVSLVCFAKKFDDLPISQRCGEIIRVHRASVGTY